MEKEIEKKLEDCPRCGGNHPHLLFLGFERPMWVRDDFAYTHWASCPDTGEPVLYNPELEGGDGDKGKTPPPPAGS